MCFARSRLTVGETSGHATFEDGLNQRICVRAVACEHTPLSADPQCWRHPSTNEIPACSDIRASFGPSLNWNFRDPYSWGRLFLLSFRLDVSVAYRDSLWGIDFFDDIGTTCTDIAEIYESRAFSTASNSNTSIDRSWGGRSRNGRLIGGIQDQTIGIVGGA